MNREPLKKAAGYEAAKYIEDGMIVGLGTGSTVRYFIEKLIERTQKESLRISVIASSQASVLAARAGNLTVLDPEQVESIDITVDGADAIDGKKRMVKGGGGALLREKIIATMSREMIVIVDEEKHVSSLGSCKLPVEVLPFGCLAVFRAVQRPGTGAEFRKKTENSTLKYTTDNGNYIIDIRFSDPDFNPEQEEARLQKIPGVIETGFFFRLAGRVITAYKDGQVIVTP